MSSDQPGDPAGRFSREPFRPAPAQPDAAAPTEAAAGATPTTGRELPRAIVSTGLVVHHGRADPAAVADHLDKSTATYASAVLLADNGDFDNAVGLAHKSAHHASDALMAHRAVRLAPSVNDRHRGHVDYFVAELAHSGLVTPDSAAALGKRWQSILDIRNRETYRAFRVQDPKPAMDTARSIRRYCHLLIGKDAPDDQKHQATRP